MAGADMEGEALWAGLCVCSEGAGGGPGGTWGAPEGLPRYLVGQM